MLPTRTDLRNAWRGLWRSPTLTICAIGCLALGIGSTTALWSAISTALLRPLPFREPDRLVAVHRTTPQSGPTGAWSQSPANYLDFSRQTKTIANLAAASWLSAVINLPNDAVQVDGHTVTGNFFETIGARPQLGRDLRADDDSAGAPLVGVISDELWRSTFGGQASVVNSTVSIDGQPTLIVGVTPHDFRVPIGPMTFTGDLWRPMHWTPQQTSTRYNNNLRLLGRLAPGATVENAATEFQGLYANLAAQYPDLKGDNARVVGLDEESIAKVRKPLLLVFAAVCMVLLVAATNVAALLLARGVQRRREMAVRAALGASRWDSLRTVLTESFVLSAMGVAIGIALAAAGVKSIGLLAAERMPQLAGLSIDSSVLAFALALGAVVTLLCGAVPALRSARVDPQDALRGGRGGGAGREQHRALRSLVVLEISLSLILLIGAGLVLKGFTRLMALDPGFDANRILTLRANVATVRYPNDGTLRQFLEPTLAEIQRVPGVEAASDITCVPYLCWGNNSGIRYENNPDETPTHWPIVETRYVSPTWFDVTKQRLASGRVFTWDDDINAPKVVVVNEALVKRDFPGQDPIGKRMSWDRKVWFTIVGVVSDIKNNGPIAPPNPEMYFPMRQIPAVQSGSFNIMVRTKAGAPLGVASAVRAAIRRVDQTAAVSNLQSMDDVIAKSLGAPRFYFALLGSFAAIAILLAVAGLYGVLSYTVAQRTREIGIRSALGSTRGRIMTLIASEGLKLVGLGVAVGLAGGVAVTRLMESMLYGVSPLDVGTWVLSALVLSVAGMLAAIVPAQRAARVDPLIAIQVE
ncbi:MAG TPA: ABC transporter permease [Gemmatimonadaceae bacterium]